MDPDQLYMSRFLETVRATQQLLGNTDYVPLPADHEYDQFFRLEMRDNGNITVCNQPLCKLWHLGSALEIVQRRLSGFIKDIPEDDPWRDAKVTHGAVTAAGSGRVFTELERGMCAENYHFLIFCAAVHDIGRAVQAKMRYGLEVPERWAALPTHGLMSVAMLDAWGILPIFTEEARHILKFAVGTHDIRDNPVLPSEATETDRMAHFFSYVLKDMDKMGVFKGKTHGYLSDPVVKKAQNMANGLCGEQHQISPVELIDVFEAHQLIDRSKCVSYESWLLQFAAWLFDVNMTAVLEEIARIGAVAELLTYFQSHLPGNQYRRVRTTLVGYLEANGFTMWGAPIAKA
jgi:hypothetical protein